MKIFIDTANIEEIKETKELGILDGVTTNPTLMAKEGITGDENVHQHYIDICELVKGPVSAEVISTKADEMIEEGKKLAQLHEHIVVKTPMTKDGLKALHHLSGEGIRTNCTLVFSAGQALLAAKAGADYVSPFIGRLDDISMSGTGLIQEIRHIYDNYPFHTEILAASIRHPTHIRECAESGADVITSPYKPIQSLFDHPLTDKGLEKFLSDHQKAKEKV